MNDVYTILEIYRIEPRLIWCLVQLKAEEYGILIDPGKHQIQMLDSLRWDSVGAYWSPRYGPEKDMPVSRLSAQPVLKRRAFEMVKEASDRKYGRSA